MQRAVWAPVREFYKKTSFQRTSSAHRRAKPLARNSFLVKGQGKGSPCFFPFHAGFCLCGGDQRAFRSPFGNLRGTFAANGGCCMEQIACEWQGKGSPCFFPVSRRVSPLRRRPKGFPIALWKPSGVPLLRMGSATWNSFLVKGQGNPLPLYQYPKRANPLFPSRRAGKSIPLDAITFPFRRASVPPLPPEADPPRRTPERDHTPSRQLRQARASARTAAPPPR